MFFRLTPIATVSAAAILAATGCGAAHRGRIHSSMRTNIPAGEASDSPLTFGQPASSNEEQAIAAVVKKFYKAAARDDGRALCSLLYSLFEETVATDYGSEAGPADLRGNSCRVVMTKLYREHRRQHVADLAKLRVTAARVSYRQALALLSFGGRQASRYIALKRERSTWKMDALVDQPLPPA